MYEIARKLVWSLMV